MSEYQFYEFAAVDRPVTEQESPYPWSVSSRAEVTPWRWRNVYNWGDFRGSPQKMMELYDAHVCVTNWGTFQFMLAFPGDLLTPQTVQPYLTDEWLDVDERAGRTILWWRLGLDEGTGEWVEGEGLLDLLLPIRAELLCGDFRSLYLGWLARQSWRGDVEEGDDEEAQFELEPPVPPGLSQLTTAQQELSEQLGVDMDVLAAAAELELPMPDRAALLREALKSVPREELAAYLLRVADGAGPCVSAELNRLLGSACQPGSEGRRSLGALWQSAREHREKRLRREATEKERRRREHEAERKAYLRSLSERADSAWAEADALAEQQKATAYDQGAALLKDLRDAYVLAGRPTDYQERLAAFREANARRPALMRRIAKL